MTGRSSAENCWRAVATAAGSRSNAITRPPGNHSLGQQPGVAPAAQCPVDDRLTRLGQQVLDHFVRQDRQVNGHGCDDNPMVAPWRVGDRKVRPIPDTSICPIGMDAGRKPVVAGLRSFRGSRPSSLLRSYPQKQSSTKGQLAGLDRQPVAVGWAVPFPRMANLRTDEISCTCLYCSNAFSANWS